MYDRILPVMARFNMELSAALTAQEQAQLDAMLVKLRSRALQMEQQGEWAALPRVDRGHRGAGRNHRHVQALFHLHAGGLDDLLIPASQRL